MNTMGPLIAAVRQRPWASAADAMVLTLAMLVSVLVALEYDIVAFWDDLTDRQRRLRVEEVFLLTLVLAAGLACFTMRRLHEARLDFERELRTEADARANRALAMQDPLTGLPNRRQFTAALEAAIARPPSAGRVHAVYLLDLNGFKRVNDGHGHAAGDELLRIVAERFRFAARKDDLVARIGGDEFAVLARNVESRAKAAEIGQRFVAALSTAVVAAGRAHPIGVSVGAALFPDDGRTEEEVMHHADLAMYRAKAEKLSTLEFHKAS